MALQAKGKKNGGEDAGLRWTLAEVKLVEDRLLALGPGRTADVRKQVSLCWDLTVAWALVAKTHFIIGSTRHSVCFAYMILLTVQTVCVNLLVLSAARSTV